MEMHTTSPAGPMLYMPFFCGCICLVIRELFSGRKIRFFGKFSVSGATRKGFSGFKIQKFKKIHKNENWNFPTGFRCFPVGFRCFPGGKDCFSNVKNILVYMVLQKNYYTCIYNLNTKYPFKFRKNNISLT